MQKYNIIFVLHFYHFVCIFTMKNIVWNGGLDHTIGKIIIMNFCQIPYVFRHVNLFYEIPGYLNVLERICHKLLGVSLRCGNPVLGSVHHVCQAGH